MIDEILFVATLFFQAIMLEIVSKKFKIKKFWPFYISLAAILAVFYYILKPQIKLDILSGLVFGFVALCIITLPMFVYEAKKGKKQNRPTNLNEFIKDIIAVPTEELVFRGLLFGILAVSMGILAAALISSAVFALWHLKFNWQFLLIVFISGLGFALLYVISGSILAPIVLHASLNIGEYALKPIFKKAFGHWPA